MRPCALLALVVLLGGCGGDGESDQGSETPPSTSANAAGSSASATPEDRDRASTRRAEPNPMARGEYRRQADRICRRAQLTLARNSNRVRKLVSDASRRRIGRGEYFERAGRLTMRSGGIAQRAVGELRALSPPASRRTAADTYLDGAERQAALLVRQGAAMRRRDTKQVARLNRELARAGVATRAAARRFGFRTCGGGRG